MAAFPSCFEELESDPRPKSPVSPIDLGLNKVGVIWL